VLETGVAGDDGLMAEARGGLLDDGPVSVELLVVAPLILVGHGESPQDPRATTTLTTASRSAGE
jgi:hypothetical protein